MTLSPTRLPAPLIYEIVRRMGEEEMERPITSLWWSGVAAGLSISFSLLAQAILQAHLPDSSWRPPLTSLGYPVGFLIVVLGRQQLFTENTITPVPPRDMRQHPVGGRSNDLDRVRTRLSAGGNAIRAIGPSAMVTSS
jgi:hypothetical protein